MKKILIILFLLISFIGNAQQLYPNRDSLFIIQTDTSITDWNLTGAHHVSPLIIGSRLKDLRYLDSLKISDSISAMEVLTQLMIHDSLSIQQTFLLAALADSTGILRNYILANYYTEAQSDGRYLQTEIDPTVASWIKTITQQNINTWDTAYANSDTGINFNTVNGNFTIYRRGSVPLVQNLDGRYLTSFTELDPFSFHFADTNVNKKPATYNYVNATFESKADDSADESMPFYNPNIFYHIRGTTPVAPFPDTNEKHSSYDPGVIVRVDTEYMFLKHDMVKNISLNYSLDKGLSFAFSHYAIIKGPNSYDSTQATEPVPLWDSVGGTGYHVFYKGVQSNAYTINIAEGSNINNLIKYAGNPIIDTTWIKNAGITQYPGDLGATEVIKYQGTWYLFGYASDRITSVYVDWVASLSTDFHTATFRKIIYRPKAQDNQAFLHSIYTLANNKWYAEVTLFKPAVLNGSIHVLTSSSPIDTFYDLPFTELEASNDPTSGTYGRVYANTYAKTNDDCHCHLYVNNDTAYNYFSGADAGNATDRVFLSKTLLYQYARDVNDDSRIPHEDTKNYYSDVQQYNQYIQLYTANYPFKAVNFAVLSPSNNNQVMNQTPAQVLTTLGLTGITTAGTSSDTIPGMRANVPVYFKASDLINPDTTSMRIAIVDSSLNKLFKVYRKNDTVYQVSDNGTTYAFALDTFNQNVTFKSLSLGDLHTDNILTSNNGTVRSINPSDSFNISSSYGATFGTTSPDSFTKIFNGKRSLPYADIKLGNVLQTTNPYEIIFKTNNGQLVKTSYFVFGNSGTDSLGSLNLKPGQSPFTIAFTGANANDFKADRELAEIKPIHYGLNPSDTSGLPSGINFTVWNPGGSFIDVLKLRPAFDEMIQPLVISPTVFLGKDSVNQVNTTPPALLYVYNNGGTASQNGIMVRGATSQTGKLYDARKKDSTDVFYVDPSGNAMTLGSDSIYTNLYVGGSTFLYGLSGDTTKNMLSIGSDGHVYLIAKPVTGTGSVTSVGLSLPAEFTISGSPVTTTGTLTGTWANETTNKVFAAPNGSTGTPSFRTLVSADIPDLSSIYASQSGSYANPSWITSLAWSKITGTPTTLAGYGITNGVTNTTTVNGHALSSNVTTPLQDVTTQGNVETNGIVTTKAIIDSANVNTIYNPQGASYHSTGYDTGVIKFLSPVKMSNMQPFQIKAYISIADSNGNCMDIEACARDTGLSVLTVTSAYILSGNSACLADTIRLGKDVNNFYSIYIGNRGTTYKKLSAKLNRIEVRGTNGVYENWYGGWTVSVQKTIDQLTDTIYSTISNASPYINWASVLNTPTTVSGYGITNAVTTNDTPSGTGGYPNFITISYLRTWAGSANITTLGTITSGGLGTGAVIGGVTMIFGSDATNDMYYRNGSGVLTRFASGNNGVLITSGAGVPSISSTIPNATQDNITRLGTIASIGAPLGGTYGGTGVNNGSFTITLAGNLTTSGAFNLTLTQTGTTNVTLPTAGTLSTLAGTETFTNKRITARVSTTASGSTITPTGDASDMYTVTALAAAATIAAPSGTPTDGQVLILRIKDNGTARALTWNAIYRASTTFALPTTTTISKTMYLYFIYNNADSKWDAVGYTDGF